MPCAGEMSRNRPVMAPLVMTTRGVMYTFQLLLMVVTACHTLPRLMSAFWVPGAVLVPTLHGVPASTVVSAWAAVFPVISAAFMCSSWSSETAMCSAVICW